MLAGTNAASGFDGKSVYLVQRTSIDPDNAGTVEAVFDSLSKAETFLHRLFGANAHEAWKFYDIIRFYVD